jgi:hypothetical protein
LRPAITGIPARSSRPQRACAVSASRAARASYAARAVGVLRARTGGRSDPRGRGAAHPAGRAARRIRVGDFDVAATAGLTGAMLLPVITVVRAPDVELGTTLGTLARQHRAVRGVRAGRTALVGPTGPARDPALGPAAASKRRRAAAGRLAHGLPVHGRVVPTGAAGLVGDRDGPRARRRRHRRRARADPHAVAGEPLRQRQGGRRRAAARGGRVPAVPAGRARPELRRDAPGTARPTGRSRSPPPTASPTRNKASRAGC